MTNPMLESAGTKLARKKTGELTTQEKIESLATEWQAIISMARTNQQLEGWMMKIGIGKATVEHPMYSKNAKGNKKLIEGACVEAGISDPQRIYECIKIYSENVKPGEDVPQLANRLRTEYGSIRALLKGESAPPALQFPDQASVRSYVVDQAQKAHIPTHRALVVLDRESQDCFRNGRFEPDLRGPEPNGSYSRGCWQINSVAHPEVSDACANDLICSTAWAMPHLATEPEIWSTWRFRKAWFGEK